MKTNQIDPSSRTQDPFERLLCEGSGHDLVEYALLGALIALAACAGMGSVAKAVNDVFSSVGEKINAYIV